MGSDAVNQFGPLADLFGEALARLRPRSVAVLGVAGGNGLQHVDGSITIRVVGIDVNPATSRRPGSGSPTCAGWSWCVPISHARRRRDRTGVAGPRGPRVRARWHRPVPRQRRVAGRARRPPVGGAADPDRRPRGRHAVGLRIDVHPRRGVRVRRSPPPAPPAGAAGPAADPPVAPDAVHRQGLLVRDTSNGSRLRRESGRPAAGPAAARHRRTQEATCDDSWC